MKRRIHTGDVLRIPPTSDIFIRYLFGHPAHRDILLSFINAVHEDSGFPRIVEAEVANPFNLRARSGAKESVLDIRARDEHGRQYDIEMQSEGDLAFKARSLYYWSRVYADQISDGDEYELLKPVIFIGILDFPLFPDTPSEHLCFVPRELHDPELVLTDHMVMHFLQVPFAKDADSKLGKWLGFLKYEGLAEEETMKILLSDDDINQAHGVYRRFTGTEELRQAYEDRVKWRRDQAYLRKIAMRKGREEGLQAGRTEGRVEGLAEGRRDGFKEAVRTIAQTMKRNGLDDETIKRLTGLVDEDSGR